MGFDFAARRIGSTKTENIGEISEDVHEAIFLRCRNSRFRKLLGDYYKTKCIFRGNEIAELVKFLNESKQSISPIQSYQIEEIVNAIAANENEFISVQGD